jgi:phage baseplate assembly protein W
MSKPVLLAPTDSPLQFSGAERDGTRNVLRVAEPGLLVLLPISSGNSTPEVRVLIDWGDGITLQTPLLPILRPHQFQHTWEHQGDYWVTVRISNSDGEISDIEARATLPVRVKPKPPRQGRLVRFAGPYLPTPKLGVGIAAIEDLSEILELTLATTVSAGVDRIPVSGVPGGLRAGASVVISQPGRLVTYAKILSIDGQTIQLDIPLNDSYDSLLSKAEIINQPGRRTPLTKDARLPEDWALQVGYDEDLIRSSLSLAFAIAPGEVRFRPDLGCRLTQLVFSQADPLTTRLVEAEIRRTAALEPRATIEDIDITTSGDTVAAKLRMRQLGSAEAFDVIVPVNNLGGTSDTGLF